MAKHKSFFRYNCDCDCHKHEYEFLFVADTHPHECFRGMMEIKTRRGHDGWDALKPWREGIGAHWSVQGFRRKGSKRWNKCYVKSYPCKNGFWPYQTH